MAICPCCRSTECPSWCDYRLGKEAERRAVLLRVAGELRNVATHYHNQFGDTLRGLATKYEREAAEVK